LWTFPIYPLQWFEYGNGSVGVRHHAVAA
jgi:hypothetical protein